MSPVQPPAAAQLHGLIRSYGERLCRPDASHTKLMETASPLRVSLILPEEISIRRELSKIISSAASAGGDVGCETLQQCWHHCPTAFTHNVVESALCIAAAFNRSEIIDWFHGCDGFIGRLRPGDWYPLDGDDRSAASIAARCGSLEALRALRALIGPSAAAGALITAATWDRADIVEYLYEMYATSGRMTADVQSAAEAAAKADAAAAMAALWLGAGGEAALDLGRINALARPGGEVIPMLRDLVNGTYIN